MLVEDRISLAGGGVKVFGGCGLQEQGLFSCFKQPHAPV